MKPLSLAIKEAIDAPDKRPYYVIFPEYMHYLLLDELDNETKQEHQS